jgi:beta-glucanase (GH16 family)
MRLRTAEHGARGGRQRLVTVFSAILALGAIGAAAVVVGAGVVAKGSKGAAAQSAAAGPSATAPLTPDPTTKVTVTPPRGWKLAFNSSFATASTLNASAWATCYWWAPGGCTNFGNSGEKEWYQPSQVTVSNGMLHLVAQHTPTQGLAANGKPKEYACRSGMVTTMPGFNFKYGMVQMVARLPYSKGLWSAFWLAATNKQWPPEVDVFEHWDTDPRAKVYLHPLSGIRQGGYVPTPGNLGKGWHTFTLNWTKSSLTWYIDGYRVLGTKVGVPQQTMYLVANVADTSTDADACAGTMLIKSVKVWQP